MKHRYLNFKYVWLSLFALLSFQFAQAQTDLTGNVADAETGEGLPGVNILIKGTTSGTVTDFDGNYTLSTNETDILVVSFVGFLSQEILVGNKSVIDIRLEEDIKLLEVIVVTGYGTQTKKEVSSSITSERKFL